MTDERKMHQAVSGAEKAAQSTTDRVARAAHQAVDSLSEYGARTEERLRETGKQASRRSRQYAEQVGGYVNERPLAAIAIAAGVGLLFGLLMRGR
ncbi:MAG: YqjD family protein [Gammaproteobacteria bacterium]